MLRVCSINIIWLKVNCPAPQGGSMQEATLSAQVTMANIFSCLGVPMSSTHVNFEGAVRSDLGEGKLPIPTRCDFG